MATYTYDKEKGGLSERRSEKRANLDDLDRQAAPDGDGPDVVKELSERIAGVLRYEPDTGAFYWRVARRRVKAGAAAGAACANGYVQITVLGTNYLAHRLAWLLQNGCWPTGEVDHMNGNRWDNRMVNLRDASRTQNLANAGLRSDNTSGHKGVTWYKSRHLWMAQLNINRRHICLGYFADKDAAIAAYAEAARRYFGDFARPV